QQIGVGGRSRDGGGRAQIRPGLVHVLAGRIQRDRRIGRGVGRGGTGGDRGGRAAGERQREGEGSDLQSAGERLTNAEHVVFAFRFINQQPNCRSPRYPLAFRTSAVNPCSLPACPFLSPRCPPLPPP